MVIGPEPDELQLISQLKKGDTDAAGALMDLHGEALMRYLYSIMGTRESAEDVFQDSWVKRIDGVLPVKPVFAMELFCLGLYKRSAHICIASRPAFLRPWNPLLWHGHGNAVSHCDCRRMVFYLSRRRPARHEPVAVDIYCHLHTQPAGNRHLPDPAQAGPDGMPRLPGKAGTSVIVLPAVRPPVQTEVFRMRCHRRAGTSILRVLRRQFEGTS